MAVELNIVLSAELSGRKAIHLSWTAEQNANFEVFWKSNVPAGQEFALLASTNAFEYTTGDLEPTKTYQFYIRGWIGDQFYISNAVELFVSCGKGVVLTGGETDEPPCQLAVIGRCQFINMSTPPAGNFSCFVQDPVDKNSFYFLAEYVGGGGAKEYKLWKFTWPSTSVLIATIVPSGPILYTKMAKIAYSPSTGAYHYAFMVAFHSEFAEWSNIWDVNLTTGIATKGDNGPSLVFVQYDGAEMYSYVDGVNLWFCVSGQNVHVFSPSNHMYKKLAGSTTTATLQINVGTTGMATWSSLGTPGRFVAIHSSWYDLNYLNMTKSTPPAHNPSLFDLIGGGIPMNVIEDGNIRYRFACGDTNRYFTSFDVISGAFQQIVVQAQSEGTGTAQRFSMYKKTNYSLMAWTMGKSLNKIIVSKVINTPSLVIYGTRSIVIDSGVNAQVQNCFFAYPYVYVQHQSGDLGYCFTKICNGVG